MCIIFITAFCGLAGARMNPGSFSSNSFCTFTCLSQIYLQYIYAKQKHPECKIKSARPIPIRNGMSLGHIRSYSWRLAIIGTSIIHASTLLKLLCCLGTRLVIFGTISQRKTVTVPNLMHLCYSFNSSYNSTRLAPQCHPFHLVIIQWHQ